MLSVGRAAEGIALLTIDRPGKRNALDPGFWGELTRALDRLEADDAVRAAVLTGAGDAAFSAGGDIASFQELDSLEAIVAYERVCFGAFRRLEGFDKPLVAAVRGYALAGGSELAFACDVVVAGESASFGVPEVRIGLAAGYASVRFGASVRDHALRSLTLTGRRVGAREAQQLGLAQLVVPDEEVLPTAVGIARAAGSQDGAVVRHAKQLAGRDRSPGDLDAVIDALSVLHLSADKFEGVSAFVSRREPEFRGR
jgi:enoyl-CoA hydratase